MLEKWAFSEHSVSIYTQEIMDPRQLQQCGLVSNLSKGVSCDYKRYTLWVKTQHTPFLPNIDRFSKFFQLQIQQWLCNETVIKDLLTPQTHRYATTPTHTSIRRRRLKSFTSCVFFLVELLSGILQWNVLRSGLFSGQKSGSSTGLLHYCTLKAANDAQNVRVDTAHGRDNDLQNLSKMII